MTTTPSEPVGDDDIETVTGGGPAGPADADATDADADATDADADATDAGGADADATDA